MGGEKWFEGLVQDFLTASGLIGSMVNAGAKRQRRGEHRNEEEENDEKHHWFMVSLYGRNGLKKRDADFEGCMGTAELLPDRTRSPLRSPTAARPCKNASPNDRVCRAHAVESISGEESVVLIDSTHTGWREGHGEGGKRVEESEPSHVQYRS